MQLHKKNENVFIILLNSLEHRRTKGNRKANDIQFFNCKQKANSVMDTLRMMASKL